MEGQVQNGWSWVVAVYALTWVVLLLYTSSLFLRARARKASSRAETGRSA